jgi:predicted nucleic acid-binding Zn ribbon protein
MLLGLATVAAVTLSGCGDSTPADPQVVRAGQLDIKLPPGWKVTDGGAVRPGSAGAAGASGDIAVAAGTGDTVPLAKDDPTTAFFKAGQSFQQCLKDNGTTFRGAPDASNPDSPTNEPGYIKDLSTCAAKSGIVQAMTDMQKAQEAMSPAEIEKQNKGYLKWRTCMIGKGWVIGEPKPDAQGRLFSFSGGQGPQITPPAGQSLLDSKDMQSCTAEAQG